MTAVSVHHDVGFREGCLRIRLLSDPRPTDYRRSAAVAGNLAVRLSGDFQVPPPDALAPFHKASQQERSRRVRDVLIRAWRVYRRGELSMLDAVNEGAGGAAEGEYAKISLRSILLELNLTAWETHPNRTRDDVHALFRKAINRLAHRPGGWQVSR